MTTSAARLRAVRDRIADAARRSGRNASEVKLVAVSKTFPVARILELHAAGVTDFGENRAQEMESKAGAIEESINWHFVGRLQSNKAKLVVGVASLIHSIDALHTAEAVSRRAQKLNLEQSVLIEVNTSGETTKSGVAPEEAISLARSVDELPGVSVAGLMTIPAWPESPEDSRSTYRAMVDLRDELAKFLPHATELSMGMTRDFEVAVEEGATIVRVGEALFGPRKTGARP